MNFSANLQFQLKHRAKLNIIILFTCFGLTGCSDLSAKAPDTANPSQSANIAQSLSVLPPSATPPNALPSDTHHPETYQPETQSPAEKGSIWVSVANTMANMRCH